MFQSDGRERPKRRFDSWYDQHLVIRKGEDILESIDDAAIKEIRRLKLAWKYWEDVSELGMMPIDIGVGIGLRSIGDVNHVALAEFAISVLWRAGASKMADMQGFHVSEALLEQARQVIVGDSEFNPNIFPIKVFQFATKGPIHNVTPMNHEMVQSDGAAEKFFRIFANGLFFHIVDTTSSQPYDLGRASWYLGNADRLDVICLDFEKSAQREFAMSVFDHFISVGKYDGKRM